MVAAPPPRTTPGRARYHAADRTLKKGALPFLWLQRLVPGKRITVAVPKGSELRITSVCGRATVSIAPEATGESGKGEPQFRLHPDLNTRAALCGTVAKSWFLEVHGDATMEVDLAGYFSHIHEAMRIVPDDTEESSEEEPAEPVYTKGSMAIRAAAEKEAAEALARLPPKPTPVPYNPLKPAALNVYAPLLKPTAFNKITPEQAKAAQDKALAARAAAGDSRALRPGASIHDNYGEMAPLPLHKSAEGGFPFEVWAEGEEDGETAKKNAAVQVKFSLRQINRKKKESKEKMIEQGEIELRIGHASVDDGWVTGHLNLEEVLAYWSRSFVGMRVGSKRRIHVPAGKGFRNCDDVDRTLGYMFDVEMRRIIDDGKEDDEGEEEENEEKDEEMEDPNF